MPRDHANTLGLFLLLRAFLTLRSTIAFRHSGRHPSILPHDERVEIRVLRGPQAWIRHDKGTRAEKRPHRMARRIVERRGPFTADSDQRESSKPTSSNPSGFNATYPHQSRRHTPLSDFTYGLGGSNSSASASFSSASGTVYVLDGSRFPSSARGRAKAAPQLQRWAISGRREAQSWTAKLLYQSIADSSRIR